MGRCHFFYRGPIIRWITFLIYCWFSSLMILQLMDSLCLGRIDEAQNEVCNVKRIAFITCDTLLVIYCVMVLTVWNKLKSIDMDCLRRMAVNKYPYYLEVESYAIREIFVFIGVFVLTFALCETWLHWLVVDRMMLPFS